jgi:cell division septation protein DedD
MKLSLPALVLSLSLFASSVVAQDFKNGLYAADRGDFAGALQVWRPLAVLGDANAQYQLGVMYYFGVGVPRDYSEALKWQFLAAAQGHAKAQNNLAVMYAYGEGVPQNHAVSVVLYRLSAEQGYSVAQYSLGTLYETGVGIKQDREEAYMWHMLATEQGYETAKLALLSLGGNISADQKNAASARVLERQGRERAYPIGKPDISAEATSPRELAVSVPREDIGSASPRQLANTMVKAPVEITSRNPPTDAGGPPWRIQLVSLKNELAAEAEWRKLQQTQDLLQDLKLHVQQAKLSKGTFYRVQAGPLADRATAVSLCSQLKSRKQDCLVVAP